MKFRRDKHVREQHAEQLEQIQSTLQLLQEQAESAPNSEVVLQGIILPALHLQELAHPGINLIQAAEQIVDAQQHQQQQQQPGHSTTELSEIKPDTTISVPLSSIEIQPEQQNSM
jgi:hypothetical protein